MADGGRVRALDAARGLAVASMILVNNVGDPGSTPRQLLHAPWHGMTFADVVFPAFVVMVGASAAVGTPRARRVIRRVVLLIALGLLVNAALAWPVSLGDLRWTGVLQRIALVVLVLALVARRLTTVVPALGVAALLLVVHLAVLSIGALEPADNVARSLDRWLIPAAHLYAGPTDPEGLLGTLSAAACGLLGLAAGRVLLRRDAGSGLRCLALGAALGAAGVALGGAIPLNKRLWTPSFALLTAGIAIAVLAALAAVEPTRIVRAFAPAEWLGRNAIVVYVGSEVLARTTHRLLWPAVDDALAGAAASVSYAALVVLIWLGVASAMHWRRWHVTV